MSLPAAVNPTLAASLAGCEVAVDAVLLDYSWGMGTCMGATPSQDDVLFKVQVPGQQPDLLAGYFVAAPRSVGQVLAQLPPGALLGLHGVPQVYAVAGTSFACVVFWADWIGASGGSSGWAAPAPAATIAAPVPAAVPAAPHQPSGPPPPPWPPAAQATEPTSPSSDAINSALDSAAPAVLACVGDGTDLVIVSVSVESTGEVLDVSLAEGRLPDEPFACVIRALKTVSLPAWHGPTVTVRHMYQR